MSDDEPNQVTVKTIPVSISPQRNIESIRSHKGILFKRQRVFNDITPSAYVESDVFDGRLFSRILIHIINNHPSNAIDYKINACIDPEKWTLLQDETVLAAASDIILALTDVYVYVKIQLKYVSAAANVTAFISGKTP
jgi:hypothetical protein